MEEKRGRWTVLEALEHLSALGPADLEEEVGRFVLVAHLGDPADEDGGAWSYATVVAKPTMLLATAPKVDPDQLRRSVVYAVRKRTTRFPGTILIGRASSNDICIDSPEVSKLHARIRLTDEGLMIEDAGSRNGTTVEGEPLRRESKVNPGETIGFGTYAVTVYAITRFAEHLKRIASRHGAGDLTS